MEAKRGTMGDGGVVIYAAQDGQATIDVKVVGETVWLSQAQMADLFGTDRTSILRHIKNIYKTGELEEAATCAFFAQVRSEGKRTVRRRMPYFNLDVIIAVGYRVNSIRGAQFRIWANRVLKEYLVRGYAIDSQLDARKYGGLSQLVQELGGVIGEKPQSAHSEADELTRVLEDYAYALDTLDAEGVMLLAKHMPNNKAAGFLDWFTYSDNSIDGRSRKKAYQLFGSGLLESLEPGSVKCLQQSHAYIFGGLYDFAGQIRTKNISKGGFTFANCMYFPQTLRTIENMPETTFDEIMDKYVEMDVAHPFMEGNGRSTRIWLDLMLRRSLRRCVDWSRIDKGEYLAAMRESVSDSRRIKDLVRQALTTKIDDREMFMKGIDYSYYYEQEE